MMYLDFWRNGGDTDFGGIKVFIKFASEIRLFARGGGVNERERLPK